MDYASPGAAFSSALESSLLQRHQQDRQAQQDALAAQREARINKIQEEERQQAQQALAEKRLEFAQAQNEKQKASFEKSIGTMVPGDIPSPEMVDQAKKFGMGHLFPEIPNAVANAAPAPEGIASPDIPVAGGPMPAPVPEAPLPVQFAGSPQQREAEKDKANLRAYVDSLPDGPEKKAEQYFLMTGKPAPAGMFKPEGGATVPTYRSSADRKVVETLQPDGTWKKVTGDVQKDGHWLQEPVPAQPKDDSLQRENQRIAAHKTATTQLDKVATPYENKLAELDAVRDTINERSVAADAHLAPMLLKALVAGTGSGFRMTKSEIDQVQNARTKWQSMEAAFRKWAADPKDALFFDDAQRNQFTRLVDMMQRVTERHLDPINTARNDIDNAKTPLDIQKRMTALHTVRSVGTKAGGENNNGESKPKVIRYDLSGKVIPND